MKNVILKQLTLENFKSFRASTVIDLTGDPGMTFVAGDNRMEPRLGQNGAGKSTIWDAVCFCLYGVSVRGARVTDLVAHGAGKCVAVVACVVDGRDVVVRREGPPAHAFIDNQRVEQPEIDRLIGLTRQRFLNSVVFGQAVPLFVDLPIPQRGELLDELLDSQVWLRASDRARERATGLAAEHNRLKVEIGRTEGSLEALDDTAEVQVQIDGWTADRDRRRGELSDESAVAAKELRADERRLSVVSKLDPEVAILLKAYQSLQVEENGLKAREAVLRADAKRIADDLAFFRDTDQCPSCEQTISPNLAGEHVRWHEAELGAVEAELEGLSTMRESVVASRIAAERAWRKADEADRARRVDKARLGAQVEAQRRALDRLKTALAAVEAQVNPHVARLEELRRRRRTLREELRAQRRRERVISSELASLDFWRDGFRRVRLYSIDRVLRQFELETMNAAQSLGLVGWRIGYATETETRSGTSKLGVQVTVSSPGASGQQFVTWSPGEGQRVRLASALGLAGLIQRWSGVRWGIEVFDEPTNWLSEVGIEDLLDLLRHRAEQTGRSVYICDHRGLQHAGFDRVITVVKGEQGSYIQ